MSAPAKFALLNCSDAVVWLHVDGECPYNTVPLKILDCLKIFGFIPKMGETVVCEVRVVERGEYPFWQTRHSKKHGEILMFGKERDDAKGR